MKEMKRNGRENREIRWTYWGVAGGFLAYLLFVCAVKGNGFAMAGIAALAVLLGAAVTAVAERLSE